MLPWPTTMYGMSLVFGSDQGSSDCAGVGLFYPGTLAVIAGLGGLIGRHARRRPELLDPDHPINSLGQRRAWFISATFLVIGFVSLVAPLAARFMPVLLAAAPLVTKRRLSGQHGNAPPQSLCIRSTASVCARYAPRVGGSTT